jgi:hypothetical protein
MDTGVKSLYPPVKTFAKFCDLGNWSNRDTGCFNGGGGATGRNNLDTVT